MTAESVLFWVFAIATVVSAVGVIVTKNPIASAMSLVATFFFLAGIYVLLWAHTIAVLQILVYAGAIMVLFLFVIMLLVARRHGGAMVKITPSRILGSVATAGLLAALVLAFRKLPEVSTGWTDSVDKLKAYGTLAQLGDVLYKQWLFPFEAVSLLLLVAIVGAVVVAKPRI